MSDSKQCGFFMWFYLAAMAVCLIAGWAPVAIGCAVVAIAWAIAERITSAIEKLGERR